VTRLPDRAAIVVSILELLFAAIAKSSEAAATNLQYPILIGFGFVFFLALIAAARMTRLLAARYPERSPDDEFGGPSFKEFRGIFSQAPRAHRVFGWGGLVLLIATLVFLGPVTWTTGEPFTQDTAIAAALYTASLCALFAPLLAALEREFGA
jgi:hypothetical protein